MNLMLLNTNEETVMLPLADRRARHVIDILKLDVGDSFDVGSVDGRVGKGYVREITDAAVTCAIEWTDWARELHPITLICGLPRPQTARRILREATTLGVRKLIFCGTDRGEPNYGNSKLWTTGEWKRHVADGAEQAFNPRMPEVEVVPKLSAAIAASDADNDRTALDNYESKRSFAEWTPAHRSVTIALGAERGWSPDERILLRDAAFSLFHLGDRVLRLDTAVVAALSIALSRMGAI